MIDGVEVKLVHPDYGTVYAFLKIDDIIIGGNEQTNDYANSLAEWFNMSEQNKIDQKFLSIAGKFGIK